MSSFLTTVEAAKVLGTNDQMVRHMLKAGDIPGQRIGKQWIVSKEWVDANRGLLADRSTARTANGRTFRPYGEMLASIDRIEAKLDRLLSAFDLPQQQQSE